MPGSLVSLQNVALSFPLRGGGDLRVLNRVSLDVHQKEFIAVLGPSGCGKSSLLRVVAGLLEPTAGTRVCGHGVSSDDPLCIGMNFQRPVLLPWLSLRDNALLPFEAAGVPMPEGAPARLEALIELAGLHGFGDALPRELSGGMQMRASLIRTFIASPRLALMDEPFSALDEVTRFRLGMELRRLALQSECSILFVTHNVQEAVFLADRVVLLSARPARIVAEFAVPLGSERHEAKRDDPGFTRLCRHIREHIDYA